MAQSTLTLTDYQYLKGVQKFGKTVLHETSKFATLTRLVQLGYVQKDPGKLHRSLQGDVRARDPASLIGQYILTRMGEDEMEKDPPPSEEVLRLRAEIAELERIVVNLVNGAPLEKVGLNHVTEILARQGATL